MRVRLLTHLSTRRILWVLGMLILFSMGANLPADVLLRNATLKTDNSASNFNAIRQVRPSSGSQGALQIFTFNAPLSELERAVLKKQGIEPLRYLPDNSWICRVRPSEKVEAAASDDSFLSELVIWSGEYKPEYKILKSITDTPGWNLSGTPQKIRVILAQDTSEEEIESLKKMIHSPGQTGKQGNAIFLNGQATGMVLEELILNPNILWIEPAAKPKLLGEVAAKIIEGDSGAGHLTFAQDLGYDGSGVVTAVADTGMDSGRLGFLHPDLNDQIKALFFYGDVISAADEHGHGTHVAGSVVANGMLGWGTVNDDGYLFGLGTAPGAKLVAQRIIDKTGSLFLTEDFQQLALDAYREGVSVVNNSWGAEQSGRYDSYAAEYDGLVRDSDFQAEGSQEMAYIFAAGNSGPGTQTLITPGVGKNVITVGASQSAREVLYIYEDGIDAMADFSSRGPTEDGRYKPDIVAPGTWISSTRSSSAPEGNEWLGIDDHYTYMGGTSMASPLATGAAAVIIQYFREMCGEQSPSPSLLKALMISTATDMNDDYGTRPVPNNDEGWGRLWLPEVIGSDRTFLCENQSVLLRQGEQWSREVLIKSSEEPLKITMAYTDVPGLPSAVLSLVNDLDLQVTAPDGTVYYGNQFLNGSSIPGSSPDRRNNVEGFYLPEPMPGMYTVSITAFRVSEDARTDTAEIDQDFSLVIAGDLAIESEQNLICLEGSEPTPLPSRGILLMDRGFYRDWDNILVTLYDADLDPKGKVTVTVTSDSFPQGRKLDLLPIGGSGFAGKLRTVNALVDIILEDDMLPVLDGEMIIATYYDAHPEAVITATALTDSMPPQVVAQESWFSFGKITIYLETDTLSKTSIRYGSDRVLDKEVTVPGYRLEHEFYLSGLQEGVYYYLIEAVDQAGNVTIEDNNGEYFTFQVEKSASILLVDGVSSMSSGELFGFEIIPPPLSGYTDPLDALGYRYELWSLDEMGSLPLLEDLIAYDAVIWRLNDMNYLDLVSTYLIPAENLEAIVAYVQRGGAFFLSSMEILSWGSPAFQNQVLHVASYTEDTEAPFILGVPGSSIGNSVDLWLDYSEFPRISDFYELGPDLSDTFVVGEGASAVFHGELGAVGVQYPSSSVEATSGRTVFFSFPIDAIPMEGDFPNNRVEIFRRVLQFLCPGLDGYGSLAFTDSAYTVPSLATIELADSDLAGMDGVAIQVYTDSDAEKRELKLLPSVYPGVFRGFIALKDLGQVPSEEYLRAADGDFLYAEYLDESQGRTEKIQVEIDTIAPTISETSIELDYMDGKISWLTDEMSDSLVEFGETPSLGRSVYNEVFTYTHSLTITKLLPDKVYYFRVSSRDAAKNTSCDDNAGKLYLLKTPAPLSLPWEDDFETENSLWLTMSDSSTLDWGNASIWERGTPSPALADVVPGAYSGSSCYGINLQASHDEVSIAALFSPALYIPEGTQATLSFMTAYDMIIREESVLLNAGELSITADNGLNWVTLDSFADDSTGGQWEEVEVDLSRWAGSTVRFQWYYNFLSIGSDQIPGWYIDDVSVRVENSGKGELRVVSNLSAGQWKLSSAEDPLFDLSGGGLSYSAFIPTDCDYTLSWEEVPWHITPQSETKTLAPEAGSVLFEGVYSINDENKNQIADEWEEFFFEKLLSPGEEKEDSDGDGLRNQDEFWAGTDPLNPASNLKLFTRFEGEDSQLSLVWLGVKGKSYQLQSSIDLKEWSPEGEPMRPDADGELSVTVPQPANASGWYRIEMTP